MSEPGITPSDIRDGLMEEFKMAAEAGIRVTILNGTIMLQRISGTPRPPASIDMADLPEVRRWGKTPQDASLDSQPGDAVRCPIHDAPAVIEYNDGSMVRALGWYDHDKWWLLDCGCYAVVKAPRP